MANRRVRVGVRTLQLDSGGSGDEAAANSSRPASDAKLIGRVVRQLRGGNAKAAPDASDVAIANLMTRPNASVVVAHRDSVIIVDEGDGRVSLAYAHQLAAPEPTAAAGEDEDDDVIYVGHRNHNGDEAEADDADSACEFMCPSCRLCFTTEDECTLHIYEQHPDEFDDEEKEEDGDDFDESGALNADESEAAEEGSQSSAGDDEVEYVSLAEIRAAQRSAHKSAATRHPAPEDDDDDVKEVDDASLSSDIYEVTDDDEAHTSTRVAQEARKRQSDRDPELGAKRSRGPLNASATHDEFDESIDVG